MIYFYLVQCNIRDFETQRGFPPPPCRSTDPGNSSSARRDGWMDWGKEGAGSASGRRLAKERARAGTGEGAGWGEASDRHRPLPPPPLPSLSSLSPVPCAHTESVFFPSSSRFLFVLRTLGAAIPHPAPLPPPPISPTPNSPTPPTPAPTAAAAAAAIRPPHSSFFPEAIHRPAHPSSSPRRAGSRPARPFLSRRARSLRVPSPRRPPRPHRAFSARSRLSSPPIPPRSPPPLPPVFSHAHTHFLRSHPTLLTHPSRGIPCPSGRGRPGGDPSPPRRAPFSSRAGVREGRGRGGSRALPRLPGPRCGPGNFRDGRRGRLGARGAANSSLGTLPAFALVVYKI
nr:hypothetical protein PBJLOJBB_PBJLOJBB_00080 [synthetic construct]